MRLLVVHVCIMRVHGVAYCGTHSHTDSDTDSDADVSYAHCDTDHCGTHDSNAYCNTYDSCADSYPNSSTNRSVVLQLHDVLFPG